MSCNLSLADLGALGDLLTGLAAAVAAGVAAFGLTTWRNELRGRAEYDLARRLLTLVYRVREGIGVVRNPFMSGEEWADRPGRDGTKQLGAAAEDTAFAYNKRWQQVSEPMVQLDAALLEAEAHWATLLTEPARELRRLVHSLLVDLRYHFRAERDEEYALRVSDEERERMTSSVFEGYGEDVVAQKLASVITKFEESLRPKLLY